MQLNENEQKVYKLVISIKNKTLSRFSITKNAKNESTAATVD